jgi:hypothetical protein
VVRTYPRASADIEHTLHLFRVDRGKKQLVVEAHGYEQMRQIEAILLELIVWETVD